MPCRVSDLQCHTRSFPLWLVSPLFAGFGGRSFSAAFPGPNRRGTGARGARSELPSLAFQHALDHGERGGLVFGRLAILDAVGRADDDGVVDDNVLFVPAGGIPMCLFVSIRALLLCASVMVRG